MRKTEDYPHELLIAFKQLQAFKEPDEIAIHFREHGIKGDTGMVSACPIAVYLWQNSDGQLGDLVVNDSGITFMFHEEMGLPLPHDADENMGYHAVGCTPAMSEFIQHFDDHCYPDLEVDQDAIVG